jgi:adenylate cyclase
LTTTIKYIILSITICFTNFSLPAQDRAVDSLENILKKTKDDTERLRLYLELCAVCDTKDNLKYTEPALDLADKLLSRTLNDNEKKIILKQKAEAYRFIAFFYNDQISDNSQAISSYLNMLSVYEEINDEEGIISALLEISNCYSQQGNMIKAMEYLQKALSLAQKLNNKKELANCMKLMGEFYSDQGNDPQALINLQKSLLIFKELKDTNGATGVLRLMGYSYGRLHNISKSIECFNKSLAMFEKKNDQVGIRSSYNSIGIVYAENNDIENALIYARKSLAIAEKLPDKTWVRGILEHIGDYYRQKGDIDKALEFHFRELKVAEETNMEIQVAIANGALARDYFAKKNYRKAKEYSDHLFAILKKYEAFPVYLRDAELLASQIDSCLGNCLDGYNHYKQYINLSNKLKSEEIRRKAIQEKFQDDYDDQKARDKAEQDKKDTVAKQELQRQKLVRNSSITGFVIVLIFAGIFISQRNRIKKEKLISDAEKKRSNDLLLNILPYEVAEELKQTGHCQAKTYSMVTVMFTDFKDFTNVSEKVSAELLVEEINFCFSEFDKIIQRYKVEKIKTIGDSYMCASGLPLLSHTHAFDLVSAAIDIRNFMLRRKQEKEALGEIPFELRIGIHTGPVVAGIVGVKKFQYDIWGDTVNIASRMESSGEPGKVNISGATYALIRDKFTCTHRGKIEAKNKGEIDMYFVEKGDIMSNA